jgi:hypothetical protein
MDADSNAGQIALAWNRKAMRAYEIELRKFQTVGVVIETAQSSPAAVDGLVATMGTERDSGIFMLTSVLEAKARWFTDEKLREVYGNRILLSNAKMKRGYLLARELGCEFWSMTVLVPSRCYYVLRLSDRSGNWVPDFYLKETATRKSINSPEMKTGMNAFIDMETAHRYTLK